MPALRIAHVTATFPPYRAGTGNVCFHNARELARRGHEVQVFTAAVAGAPARELRDGMLIRRLRPLVRVGNAPVLPGLVGALRGFDIIHLHYPFILGAEMVRLASMLYGTPVVASFHNDLIGDGARKQIFSIYQWVSARLTVRNAAMLCAVSLDHYRSSHLSRSIIGGRPPAVELSNGVDLGVFAPSIASADLRQRYGIPQDAKLILFVAALDRAHHFKGLERLLIALRRLPKETWLLVVGDGDLRQDYQHQARELGVDSRTVFAGAIDHSHTPRFFCAADLTVLPSLPPESFGLVLVESMACGTPVIASNIPGVRTVVDHGRDGLLVEPADVTALARAIEQICRDDSARQAMGRAGRAKVEQRYDWRAIGEQLERIYTDVLGSRKAQTAGQPSRAIGRGEQ